MHGMMKLQLPVNSNKLPEVTSVETLSKQDIQAFLLRSQRK